MYEESEDECDSWEALDKNVLVLPQKRQKIFNSDKVKVNVGEEGENYQEF